MKEILDQELALVNKMLTKVNFISQPKCPGYRSLSRSKDLRRHDSEIKMSILLIRDKNSMS